VEKLKPRPVVRSDGVTELLRPEDEYRRDYQKAVRLLQDEEYVQDVIKQVRGECFGIIRDRY
jgi:hypothetical protein